MTRHPISINRTYKFTIGHPGKPQGYAYVTATSMAEAYASFRKHYGDKPVSNVEIVK